MVISTKALSSPSSLNRRTSAASCRASWRAVVSRTARAGSERTVRKDRENEVEATIDDSAFVEITMRYREKMYAVAFALLKNRADAEEIAQDTFIRAHRGLANFRGESALA